MFPSLFVFLTHYFDLDEVSHVQCVSGKAADSTPVCPDVKFQTQFPRQSSVIEQVQGTFEYIYIPTFHILYF